MSNNRNSGPSIVFFDADSFAWDCLNHATALLSPAPAVEPVKAEDAPQAEPKPDEQPKAKDAPKPDEGAALAALEKEIREDADDLRDRMNTFAAGYALAQSLK